MAAWISSTSVARSPLPRQVLIAHNRDRIAGPIRTCRNLCIGNQTLPRSNQSGSAVQPPLALYIENVSHYLTLLAVKARDRHRCTPRRTASPKDRIVAHVCQRITPHANQ
jgi:hypothetical protein